MDTLHFEPSSFDGPREGRLSRAEEARRLDEVNLSDVDVFMLRGRRLQAQVVGGALRRAVAGLRELVRRGHRDRGSAGQPRRHRHA